MAIESKSSLTMFCTSKFKSFNRHDIVRKQVKRELMQRDGSFGKIGRDGTHLGVFLTSIFSIFFLGELLY